MDVLADSLLINPGTIRSRRMRNPKVFPAKLCLVENRDSSEVNIDSFQETLRKTKVRTTTKTAAFNTISKGIGKSPTLIITW